MLRQADATERQTNGLLDPPGAKGEALKAAAAKIENIEVLQFGQGRIGGQSPADKIRLLFAGQNPDLVAGRGADALAEFPAIGGVAHRAGGDQDGVPGGEGCNFVEQLADGGEAALHGFLRKLRLRLADPRADAGIERPGLHGDDSALGIAGGDKGLDRIAADVDDGDDVCSNHRDTEGTEETPFQAFLCELCASVVHN